MHCTDCMLCCLQQQPNPAVLLNHDNDYLHYEDDWYIIKSKPDVYNFVYYKGTVPSSGRRCFIC